MCMKYIEAWYPRPIPASAFLSIGILLVKEGELRYQVRQTELEYYEFPCHSGKRKHLDSAVIQIQNLIEQCKQESSIVSVRDLNPKLLSELPEGFTVGMWESALKCELRDIIKRNMVKEIENALEQLTNL